jgi:glycosyltransferase involved in cell wall biosynthesis
LPEALVFYHYLHPDDVAGAVQMSELCAGLVERGWNVTAMPCNRGCRDESKCYTARLIWNGVKFERVWRPTLRQAGMPGRLMNAGWMIARWSFVAFNLERQPDVVVIGTDPLLSILVALVWRTFRPGTKIVTWCFDLYPEAAYAQGILRPSSVWAGLLRRVLIRAYASCDLIVDIGSCMRSLLNSYRAPALHTTLVPWALHEPAAFPAPRPAERSAIFGTARLALLYSGNFGRAHSLDDLLDLARRLRGSGVHLAFSIRGNRAHSVRAAITAEDVNINFVDFAPCAAVESRLAAADIHVVTLREEWTGTVVPSKFFGALAAGRPVLFCGSPRSAIAICIQQYGLGWVLSPGNTANIAETLIELLESPGELDRIKEHCFRIYREKFAKVLTLDRWDDQLRQLLAGKHSRLPENSAVSTTGVL